MPEKDIIVEKTTNIQRCLKRIFDTTDMDSDSLMDFDVQDVFVLNLQRAIQASIDLAVHIISSEGWGVAKTLKDNFKVLEQNKIIDPALNDKLQKMVGFRNMAVHDYGNLDIDILKNILKYSIKDIEVFYTIIIKKYLRS